jgi:hypothetical protein
MKIMLKQLGWEGWILLLSGIVAIVIAVVDFSQLLSLSAEAALRLIIVATGLSLGAIAAQTAHRKAELVELENELKEAIGSTDSLILENDKEFAQHLVVNVTNAKSYVWDTVLNRAWASISLDPYISGDQAEYKRILYERVRKGELGFRRIEIIFQKVSLEQVIQRLLFHAGYHFYIRYYQRPPTAIPIMNLMSFDGDVFYFGGFHTTASPGASPLLYIRDPKLAKIYKDYWNALWNSATPLNEGRIIDWKELRKIASDLDLTDQDFDAMVDTVKESVEREKRRLRLR